MTRRAPQILSVLALQLPLAGFASAAPPSDSPAAGKGSVVIDDSTASADVRSSNGRRDRRKHLRWIDRWAPERNTGEIGIYGGVLVPSRSLELFEPDVTRREQGVQRFQRVAPDIGLRLGYYPIRHFGIEAEGGAMPTQTAGDQQATLWTARGHVVGQLGLSSVTPFLVLGAGALGVVSERAAVGRDTDAALHFGGGFKVYLSRYTMLRLDVRDVVTAKRGIRNGLTSSLEVLLGLSITLGRKDAPPPPPEKDTDGDGFMDGKDRCVNEPGVAPDGCPIGDADSDGFKDDVDKCKDEPGVAPDGCPIPDTDGDGFKDDVDACKDEAGVEPDGCPIRDTDGDGFMDPDDKCKDEPENANGFEDTDGCPDEIPKEVEQFTGVIEGIYFDTGKDTIKPSSKSTLDQAVAVLLKFPSVRVRISGHTDSTGKREKNIALSGRRAESVRAYLVAAGVAGDRIETVGVGPDKPIADNKTKAGKAKNRRIEFELLMK